MNAKIPDKVYFKIGEVAEIVGVESHVLRYWENEFPQVKPERIQSRQRLYTRKDVQLFQEIKRLLYEDQFTLAGARKRLDSAKTLKAAPALEAECLTAIKEIRQGLASLKALLDHEE